MQRRNFSSELRACALIVCALLLAALVGCSTPADAVHVPFEVKVPVPVACQEPVPERPAMPTDGLKPGVDLDAFAAAAIAEIERRKGYEGKLVVALENCRRPIVKE